MPVTELERKQSLSGSPRCSSVTLFSPQKPVQPSLVLGLWEDHLPYEEAHCLWWAVGDHPPSEAWIQGGVVGEVLVGPQRGETICSPPCSTDLPSNLGTPAYVTAMAAAVRAFVLVTVLQVVRTGR